MSSELLRYGFAVHDVVEMKREWCVVCAKLRWHEIYMGWKLCIACLEQTNPPPLPIKGETINEQTTESMHCA